MLNLMFLSAFQNSGCSTFLKAITNQRQTYLAVNGDVRYAGVDADEMKTRFPGEIVYNQEDDDHLATLTVGQTLDFALASKTPGKRLPGVSPSKFRETVQDVLYVLLLLLSSLEAHRKCG
jgi:ATP-binding cassette subfamily G (WHITE) protein 2 (SNQ2)